MTAGAEQVLQFWFGQDPCAAELAPRREWFSKDPGFDAEIARRFSATVAAARRGELTDWAGDASSCLALILVCDQFPRNLSRGTADAFATDPLAIELAHLQLQRGWDQRFAPLARSFIYLPFEHSEHLIDQYQSLRLMGSLRGDPRGAALWPWAVKHYEVIARFGRYPHRNAALGRPSTAAELAFLAQPGSSF